MAEFRVATRILSQVAIAPLIYFSSLCDHKAHAYPVLDAVVGLPDPELVTVYPDDSDKNLYYFVPTTLNFVFENGVPRFGVQYWGLTGVEQDGSSGAAVTVSVKPAFDADTVKRVADGLKKVNPNSRFAFPALLKSSMDLIVNGAFWPATQTTSEPTQKASTVDGTQAFTLAVNNRGARAFAQGVASDSDLIAARYTFSFNGVEKRLHARITVYTKRVYDHFKASGGGSGWFGLVKTSWATDWQKLTSDGSIKLEILEGGETDTDAYMIDIFKKLADQKIAGEGMFKPALSTAGLPGNTASGGGGLFGWSFNASGGWEHLDEQQTFVFEINTQKLGEREFQLGLTFSGVCAKYPTHFVDLTTLGNQCIDVKKFQAIAAGVDACIEQKLKKLQDWKQKGLITNAVWEKQTSDALDKPCIPTAATMKAELPQASDQLTKAVEVLTQQKNQGSIDSNTYSLLLHKLNETPSDAAVNLTLQQFNGLK